MRVAFNTRTRKTASNRLTFYAPFHRFFPGWFCKFIVFKAILVIYKNFSVFLIFFRHLDDCLSVTMPALFPLSARQSARNKFQNHSKSIYRTNLTLTSQGGNQGILRSASYLFKRSQKSVFEKISDRLRLISARKMLVIGKTNSCYTIFLYSFSFMSKIYCIFATKLNAKTNAIY